MYKRRVTDSYRYCSVSCCCPHCTQEMLLSYSGRAKYTLYSFPSYSCTIMSSTLTCFLTIHVVSTHLESLAGLQHQHTLACHTQVLNSWLQTTESLQVFGVCHIFCTYFLQCAPELCAKYLHLFLSVCHIFCKFFLQCAQCHIFCTYFLQCALELCAIYFAHISYSVRQNYVPYILHIFLAVCARTMCHIIFCTYFLECAPELCAIYFAHIS